ncbi:MAG TPA: hypothetical protein VFS49_04190, partial [Croceibacterium sp.]|nr:hypothetical protein [Croceibacterium sp.]
MCGNIEPLAPSLWFQRIAVIAAGELNSIENSLRHASHLIQLAPIAFRKVLPSFDNDDAFEALLESEDLESAARQLVGPGVTLLIEASCHDKPTRAVIACPDLRRTVDGTGDTVASAVLAAWANWLTALRAQLGAELEEPALPAGAWRTPRSRSVCP